MNQDDARGTGLWKFNNSLVSDFTDKTKDHIAKIQKDLDKEHLRNDQSRWQYLRHKIRKNPENSNFITRKKIKLLEFIANCLDNSEHSICKSKLNQLYDKKQTVL